VEGNGGRAQVKGLHFGMPGMSQDHDSGDRNQRLYLRVYIAISFAVIATAAGFLLVGGSLLLLLSPAIGVALGLAVAEGLWYFTDNGAAAIGRLLQGAGRVPYAPTYSAEEALIARGDYTGAASAYRDHAEANPDAVTPVLRLAELSWRHLRDLSAAERWYLEARRRAGDPSLAANQLIDLYRASNNRGRLMAELARFADGRRDSAAAHAARKELRRLKEETS
jgi:hypothetical protein